ncbi:non-ribosomal peptide synthetase [Pseudomonas yamanorum]|uniref:Amino acid adenylation domain-containing protein n=1 Tax=Pseudomonas yamanorum TaxID=515393 RepID=A0A7Y8JSW9_9PSED|nr:amino acid adenylation domain-containing protein [Pseudomonas yamanorum]
MQKLIESVGTLSLAERKALAVLLGKKGINLYGLTPVFKRDASEPLLLSYAQERLWFLWQLDPKSTAYNMSSVLRLRGSLDVPALESAFNSLIARHEPLRTTFAEEQGRTVQRVAASAALTIELQDVSTQGLSDPALHAVIEACTQQAFNLEHGPLLRVKLLRLAADEHVLVLVQHHIVSDGWSMQIMVEELIELYAGFQHGRPAVLPELAIQYADYGLWQRNWMQAGERERQQAYWQKQLGGEQPTLQLPADFPRPAMMSYRGARLDCVLAPELAAGLKHLAQREGVTLYMLLLASWQILMYRYTGQTDVRVGVAVANRSRAQTERLIGFFVNTQVLKTLVDGRAPFSQLLAQVKQTALQAQEFQDLPFEQLVELLQPERSLSHSPLFQVMYNHQGLERSNPVVAQLPQLSVENMGVAHLTAQFDLTLETYETREGLSASLVFATDLFEVATIERLQAHWLNLLQGIVACPGQSVDELPLFDALELQRLLHHSNPSAKPVPVQAVHQQIAEQARRTPAAQALTVDGQALTFEALQARANSLAHTLIEQGVAPGVLVGIAAQRSLDMVVGLLAVLKAGGAYVPLDPAYPQARLDYMIEDSGIGLLLTQASLAPRFAGLPGLRLLLLDQQPSRLGLDAQADPQVSVAPDDLAYVIYTSGSTGKPKGVMVRHGGLNNFVQSMAQRPGLSATDRVLSLTTFCFDIFGLEIYLPLVTGATIVLAGQDVAQDPGEILALVARQGVTAVQATPSTWRMLLDHPEIGCLKGCKVLCGGEALPQALASRMIEALGPVWNLYGPTETTIWSACHEVTAQQPVPYLGRAIDNTSLFIVGADFSPVPVGASGELLIGGDGLARGYHHRPSLTAERFVPDPHGPAGGRLYRTGDLVRSRADGVIEYLARLDHQIKIRGFRIELGEIEARLLASEHVREAAVLALPGTAGDQLVAYVVPREPVLVQGDALGQAAVRDTLKAWLKCELADYMVPAHLLFISAMPLTPNGKLDRKALPPLDINQMQVAYEAPQSPLQQQVATIWQEVLKVPRVGLNDDFFELGGHSLLATQVMSRVRNELGRTLALRRLFEHSTLAAFSRALAEGQADHVPPMRAVARNQPLALSYAQERQWFLWQLQPDSPAYHLPRVLRLRGPLNVDALQDSFNALVARHEPLRTTFVHSDTGPVQVIAVDTGVCISRHDWTGQEASDAQVMAFAQVQVQRPFDLERGPLLRVELLRLGADDHVLVLTQHHIASDAWSMQVMVEEWMAGYEAGCAGRSLQRPALAIQYADYAAWQRQWMDGGERERQLGYWTRQLGGPQTVLQLPTDRPRPAQQSQRGARCDLLLDASLSDALKRLAQEQGVTLFMVLLAAFQVLLYRYSGQSDIRVGVPVANRHRLEVERLIGFFVNTQVLKADVEGRRSFVDLLQQVKQHALQAQEYQDLPFEQLVEALQPERSLSHSPVFQVMFNHQVQSASAFSQLPGGLAVEALVGDDTLAKFDLTLETTETAEGIGVSWIYARDLFDSRTASQQLQDWHRLLQAFVTDARQPVGEVPLGDEASRRAAAALCTGPVREARAGDSVQQRFQAQVARVPQTIALVCGAEQLTYQQLDQRAERLAQRLQTLGIGPGSLVAIGFERGSAFVTTVLAILRVGAAFLPLDPRAQRSRIGGLLQDSGAALLMAPGEWLQELDGQVAVIPTLDLHDALVSGPACPPLNYPVYPAQLPAYVVYTSGSTGKPKGVVVTGEALVDYVDSILDLLPMADIRSMALVSTVAADLGYTVLFGALCAGRTLHVLDPELAMDANGFAEYMHRHEVDAIKVVPSHLESLLKAVNPPNALPRRCLVLGGEACSNTLLDQVRALAPACQVFNHYGPTETCVGVLAGLVGRVEPGCIVPLGQPMANVRAHVVDQNLQAVAPGVLGELYLGGPCLAQGYLGQAGMTAERFVPDPFGMPGERLYRTGDRVGLRDGHIESHGRIDDQVKIRGFRVEPGEVGACLRGLGLLSDATVMAREGVHGKQLVGYVVPRDPADLAPSRQLAMREAVVSYLREHLPEHMVVAQVVVLEKLPLTANGKLDRQALPAADMQAVRMAYQAPETDLQKQVALIWQQVLHVPQVGLGDSFFELGGHSLLVMGVLSRLQLELGIKAPAQLVFEFPTLNEFVDHLEAPAARLDASRLSRLESLLDEVDEA